MAFGPSSSDAPGVTHSMSSTFAGAECHYQLASQLITHGHQRQGNGSAVCCDGPLSTLDGVWRHREYSSDTATLEFNNVHNRRNCVTALPGLLCWSAD